jgi:hypothetical protein
MRTDRSAAVLLSEVKNHELPTFVRTSIYRQAASRVPLKSGGEPHAVQNAGAMF